MTVAINKMMRLASVVVLAAVLVTAVVVVSGIGEDDFLGYWSAARLLATGGNPYDRVSLRDLELETRPARAFLPGQAVTSWNPPWLLVILLPFGLLSFDVASSLWTACNIGLITAACLLAWHLLVRLPDRRSMPITLAAGMFFGASLSTVQMGQISGVVLIGLVVSAWWLHERRDWLAGAVLFLTTVKPHVTYFVLLLAALWVIRYRRWQFVWGAVVGGIVATIVLWAIFPGWVSAYLTLVSGHAFFQYSTSTLGGLAYALWGTNVFRFAGLLLLPFLPSLLRMADAHGWPTAMNVALLMSVPLAVYGFTFDQVVLLPAIMQMIAWVWRGELPKRWAWAIAGGMLLVYVVYFAELTLPALYYHYFAWPPVALAGLYALAWKQRPSDQIRVSPAPVPSPVSPQASGSA